jgi:hypothetical protein
MKNKKNELKKECSQIEKLILEMKSSKISDKQKKKIDHHLSHCRSCREFEKSLSAIVRGMAIEDDLKLEPDPRIQRNLLAYLHNSRKKRASFFHRIWFTVRDMLEIRIPVYQILSAVILLIFIFMGIQKLSTFHKAELTQESIPQLQEGIFNQFNVIDNLRLIDGQKIGRNFSEDSLLIKMFVRSL